MHEYVLTMLAAAAVTYLLTPLVRRFAITIGALHAARDRDVHVVPTPLLGGVAMYAGLAAGLLMASRLPGLGSVFAQTNMAKGLLLAGGLIVIMGFVDDRWGMSVVSKLAGQVAAGVILVWSGATVTWVPGPGGYTLSLTNDQQTVVTILLVVLTINAVNFIDGLDGLAAGIVGIGAAAFFIYYFTLVHRLGLPDQAGPALASAVLAGVCLGFLPHNFHPARIFMGDTGAMLIGLLLAYAPISSLSTLDFSALTSQAAYANGTTVDRFGTILPLLLPAAILLIPYADLLLAVVRRTRAGMSPFAPDKKHLHHRLLAIGHSHRGSVLIMYLWAALFSGSVVWLSLARTKLPVLVGVTVACVLMLLLVSLPRLRPWGRPAGPPGTQDLASRGARAAAVPVAAASGAPAHHAAAGSGAPAHRGPATSGPTTSEAAAGGAAANGRPPADPAGGAGPVGPGSGAAPGTQAGPPSRTAPPGPARQVASAMPVTPGGPARRPPTPRPAASAGSVRRSAVGRRESVSAAETVPQPVVGAGRPPTPAGTVPQAAAGRGPAGTAHRPAGGRAPAAQRPATAPAPPVPGQPGLSPSQATGPAPARPTVTGRGASRRSGAAEGAASPGQGHPSGSRLAPSAGAHLPAGVQPVSGLHLPGDAHVAPGQAPVPDPHRPGSGVPGGLPASPGSGRAPGRGRAAPPAPPWPPAPRPPGWPPPPPSQG